MRKLAMAASAMSLLALLAAPAAPGMDGAKKLNPYTGDPQAI